MLINSIFNELSENHTIQNPQGGMNCKYAFLHYIFLLFSYMYKEKEMCPLFIDHYITTCIPSTDHGELELVCQDDL